MWQGGGCKLGDCDKLDYQAEPCEDKPSSGIRNCPNYQMIHAASSRKKGPRPGHDHGGQGSSSAAAAHWTGEWARSDGKETSIKFRIREVSSDPHSFDVFGEVGNMAWLMWDWQMELNVQKQPSTGLHRLVPIGSSGGSMMKGSCYMPYSCSAHSSILSADENCLLQQPEIIFESGRPSTSGNLSCMK